MALAFAKSEGQPFLLGDPFQRDNLLQSAALLIPQDTSLPISIRRWDIYPQDKASNGPAKVFVRTRLQGIQDQEVETSVESLDSSGHPAEKLTGYRLKILKHHDEYPTVADLLCPDERDTRQVQDRLVNLCAGLNLKTPNVFVSFNPGLHDQTKDRRRELERSLLNKAVENWVVSNHADPSRVALQWAPSGKPEARVSDESLPISLTHDNRYCLVAVGSCSLGCDLAPITHRTPKQWSGLLGPFAKKLIDGQPAGDELDRRGTALWAAREVLQKLDVQETIAIQVETTSDDSILFNCTTDKGLITVLTFRVRLTRGRERVVAFSVTDSPLEMIPKEQQGLAYPGYEALLGGPHFKIVEGGPQGQVVFISRFPVTFMPAGQLSRHVYYSHYFFWAGEVRETSAWPVLKKITDQFSTGSMGWCHQLCRPENFGRSHNA